MSLITSLSRTPELFEAAFSLPSFAKINWVLRVLGRREDGFHELSTVFQTISLHDDLQFSSRDDGKIILTSDSSEIPLGESNLVVRAAQELGKHAGVVSGANIHLSKKIPAGAGLGGGSSNAAVALLGLARLWKTDITKTELEEIGATLGSDVPFFFTGGTALGTGLGTVIESIPETVADWLLVATPRERVSTADAYKSLNSPSLTKIGGEAIFSSSRERGSFPDSLPEVIHNDFERVVFSVYPEIARVKRCLIELGARCALMSGSGSSVFGVFGGKGRLDSAIQSLRNEDGWLLFPCGTVTREQYLDALGQAATPLRSLVSE